MTQLQIQFGGERLTLFATKALFWEKSRTMVVADLHLGKAAAFRQSGLSVPEQVTCRDLERLSDLLDRTKASRLIILGDLFHAPAGQTPQLRAAFLRWRQLHPALRVDLTLGNHDRAVGELPREFELTVCKAITEGPFVFSHEPAGAEKGLSVTGHLHPAVHRAGMRLPCFCFSQWGAVLPAFGEFTGTHLLRPAPKDRVFGIRENEILELPQV